jgi:Mn2+/Fe2+ NRAMP family transporter
MYGTGPILRQTLVHAKPWQRYLIAVAMVAGGVVLVLLGRVPGALLSLAGLFMLFSMIRYRFGRGRAASAPTTEEGRA